MFFLIVIALLIICKGCDTWVHDGNPYDEGMHFDYKIRCENGFVYKVRSREGTIQILNSDGTPLRCGEKRH